MKKSAKGRKAVKWVGWVLAFLCLGWLGMLPSILDGYKSRALLTQRVQVDKAGAELFGEGTTPIGSAQYMIIDDPKAVVRGTGSKEDPRQVDDGYLQAHKIYPLQLKTVEVVIGLIRTGCIGGLGFGLMLIVLASVWRKKEPVSIHAAG